MKITIITVVYNGEKFISDCIRSVREQVYPDIEHIILDGESSDSTCNIVKQNIDPQTVFISAPDKGMYDAINKGIALAAGQVIGLLHADDVLAGPYVISAIMAKFTETNADAVYGDLNYVSPDKRTIVREWVSRQFKRRDLELGWMPAHPTLYVQKSIYVKYGQYSLEYGSAADYEMMLRLLYRFNINAIYLPMLFVNMRVGGMSNENLNSRIKAFGADHLAARAHKLPLPLFSVVLKKLRKLNQYF
ncbi:MAG: glycosyltransferase [Sphingobacteriales bacterium]|nr:MAG: glycosyltransferase [Sphingobacteriales bacterium]